MVRINLPFAPVLSWSRSKSGSAFISRDYIFMSGSGDQCSHDTPIVRTVTIENDLGLHARPAAKIVECAEQFNAVVTLSKDGEEVTAESILDILMLGAAKGDTLELSAAGEDASPAIKAIGDLISEGFIEFEHPNSSQESSD
jgi:phosphotransferase system HPr (HPr) family protein